MRLKLLVLSKNYFIKHKQKSILFGMNAVQLQGVYKHYGKVKALDGVSLSVEQGQIFGFLGPNGAGKTTTIRCLMDFIRPSKGEVKIFGHDSQESSVELKNLIGYLPADAYLYANWTGQQHLRFASSLRGSKPDESLAQKLGLNLATPVKQLSTGNRQKLSIALAMAGQPKLLILDEPTKGLDPILQSQLYELLTQYKRAGGTVFMSSHNLDEVQKVCGSVAVIREGKIVVSETLESIRRKSIHTVSAIFASPIKPEQFKLTNVEVLHSTSHSLTLKVKGDLNTVMKLLTKQKLKDLEVGHASLEEIFLEMYK